MRFGYMILYDFQVCFDLFYGFMKVIPGIRVVFFVFVLFSCHTRYLKGSCRVTSVKING